MSARTRPALLFVSALACFVPASASAAQASPPPNPAASAETGSKDQAPLIVRNPDGTMTVQKESAPGRKGLVIHPQVVVPTVRVPEKEKGN